MITKSANKFNFLLMAVIVAWLVVYSQTLLSMAEIWHRSDTFAHGFLVYPIAIWLIWRRRFIIQEIDFHPTTLPLLPLVGCSLLWLAAEVAGIQAIAQLAAVAWLPFALWALLGHKFMGVVWFPMCYLIFAVPMGEELIPQLQNITADITVALLTLSSIPVFRDGLYISVPGGLFEVAVACSGIRYLIASVALGTLFAHLQFTSIKRQAVFIIVSALVPILANGIRAYIIVLLAYSSDMKLATGVDHLIYGWLFFGLVMFILFWIGSFWRQSLAEPPKAASRTGFREMELKSYFVTLSALVCLGFSIGYKTLINQREPLPLVLNQPELAKLFTPSSLSHWQPNFSSADDYFTGATRAKGQNIELYSAFYRQTQQGKELINATHLLFNNRAWTPILHRSKQVNGLNIGEYLLTSSAGAKLRVHYFYQLEGFQSANKVKIKALQSLKRLAGLSDAGAVLILATKDNQGAEEALATARKQLMDLEELWHEH